MCEPRQRAGEPGSLIAIMGGFRKAVQNSIDKSQRPDRIAAGQGVDHVGVAGFEPTAPRSQSECATKLRHTPAYR